MRILASAEAYGYGPASKLTAVCTELRARGATVDFKGVGIAFDFAHNNVAAFESVERLRRSIEFAAVSGHGYDGALSVMDPSLVLWAAFHKIPCVYVDSLYWLWNWPADRETSMQRKSESLLALDTVGEALAELADIAVHDAQDRTNYAQYAAHYLAARSCIQRPIGFTRRVPMLGHPNTEYIDAIVDLRYRRPAKPDTWLATTSGLLNPLSSTELALSWVHSVLTLLTEALAQAGEDAPITVIGNDEVLKLAARYEFDRLELKPLDHGGTLSAMNSAIGCLTPPGVTTMLEAAVYGTPLFLLPEQHCDHFATYELVAQGDAKEHFPQALMGARVRAEQAGDRHAQTRRIIVDLAQHCTGRSPLWQGLVAAVADGMADLRRNRATRAAAQDAVIRQFVGGYGGASQVSEHVLTLFGNR
jgi:hypothetical protein